MVHKNLEILLVVDKCEEAFIIYLRVIILIASNLFKHL